MQPLAIAAVSIGLAAGAAAQPTGLIVGQVVDAGSGRPVPGAIVGISGKISTPDGRPMSTSRVMTTADGRFVFRDLLAGGFGLTVTKPGYTEGAYGRRRPGGPSQQLTLADGERTTDVVIRLWKNGAISGTIVDEAGEPVIGAIVVALPQSVIAGARSITSGSAALTDDRGMYRLETLQPTEYIVAVVSRHMSIPSSAARSAPAGLERSMILPELGIMAMQMSGSSPALMQVGDVLYAVGGGVAVPPPPQGDRLFVYPTTYYPSTPSMAQAAALTLSAGEERAGIDVHLQPVAAARVSGTVLGPLGPVATALRLVATDAREAGFDVEGPFTVSDSQGIFTFPAVPAGHYSLQAQIGTPRGRNDVETSTLWADLPLAVGDRDLVGLSLQLQPGFQITGRFEFEGGLERPAPTALQRVPVLIQPASRRGLTSGPPVAVRVDVDGRFTSSGLPPGRYFVWIRGSPTGWRFKAAAHEGQDAADMPLDLRGDAQVVITFSDRWNSLRGTVTSTRGQPDPDAVVLLFTTDTRQWVYASTNTRRFESVRAAPSGEYSIGSIPEGEYYVVAVPDAHAGDWQGAGALEALARSATRITIVEGETRTQHLRTQETR